ncbi:MAG: hypothetical protein QOJ92_264 [Frankiales bacterium]|nr:hypothetical protein [Frankiales bacterium]
MAATEPRDDEHDDQPSYAPPADGRFGPLPLTRCPDCGCGVVFAHVRWRDLRNRPRTGRRLIEVVAVLDGDYRRVERLAFVHDPSARDPMEPLRYRRHRCTA